MSWPSCCAACTSPPCTSHTTSMRRWRWRTVLPSCMRGASCRWVRPSRSTARPEHPVVAEFLGRVNRLERSAVDVAQGVLRVGGVALACPQALAAQTRLLVRPEDLRLQPTDAAGAAAQVTRRVFLGERLQFHVRTEDQADLVCETTKEAPWRPGDKVRIGLDPGVLMCASNPVA